VHAGESRTVEIPFFSFELSVQSVASAASFFQAVDFVFFGFGARVNAVA
jgi:hypothetical protein